MLVGYARISTSDQSPALQRDALEAAGCGRIFEETASGAKRERPQLTAALDWMREGDTLVVWRLDRLARSVRQLIETVEDLGGRGIGFRSLTEAIDTTTSGGRLVFHVFGALAEFERNLIVERTRAGLEAARARGRVGGRPAALDDGAIAVAGALLRDPSIPISEVARRVGVSRATLYSYFPGGRGGDLESDEERGLTQTACAPENLTDT
ncbi:MAG: recombinase family protein [bacterium]|nr:recombinase family protein [bacterium]